jgi:hypothetical protein
MGWAVAGAKERNPVALKMTRYGVRQDKLAKNRR